jgi:hypothetical protein
MPTGWDAVIVPAPLDNIRNSLTIDLQISD